MAPKHWRWLTRMHYLLSLVFGLQVLIWIGSGLFFAAAPIDQVRGEHLRKTQAAPIVLSGVMAPELAAAAAGIGEASEITLSQRDGAAVYVVRPLTGDRRLVDARTGRLLGPLDAAAASRIALAAYGGKGALGQVRFYTEPPQEYGRPGPVYAVDFTGADAATLYVDATTGEARTVRTDLWRVYDLLWGLHIMDWLDRKNFNTLHLLAFAAGAAALSLAGLALAWGRSRRRARRQRSA